MYVKGKMISVKIIPEMEAGGVKENDGVLNLSMIYLIYCKNFCECPNVPPPKITIN
jgi:hypothetical protein